MQKKTPKIKKQQPKNPNPQELKNIGLHKHFR